MRALYSSKIFNDCIGKDVHCMDAYEKYKFTKPQSNTLVFQDWDEENQYTWQAS